MKYTYDFHLHSCLSPCGDADMTPYNLVNMAKLLDLDIIALTDHNTCGNCLSAIEVGEEVGLVVVPGMELCTAEEIHVVCLFPDIGAAEGFSAEIKKLLPPVMNRPKIFGEQIYMDAQDGELGREEILLVTASGVSIDEAPALVGSFGGFCYPAHIDRSSYSIISSFGSFPPELGFVCAEVTPHAELVELRREHPALRGMTLISSSDAHYLENIREPRERMDLPEPTPQAVITYLKSLTLAQD